MSLLKFSKANRKLKKLYKVQQLKNFLTNCRKIYSLDLPAGHTCPSAEICLSKVVSKVDTNNKHIGYMIQDGPKTEIRCYAASEEVIFPAVRVVRSYNRDLMLKHYGMSRTNGLYNLIKVSLPKDAGIIRIHSSGDFFNKTYFDSWVRIANENPDILFYGYTKHAIQWIAANKNLPSNFRITASYGGKQDHLIKQHNLVFSDIVFSKKEARLANLPIDDDDSHAAIGKESAVFLVHGIQPAGTNAAKAWQGLKFGKDNNIMRK